MQKLSGKSLLLVSFTLFSMFFGAGNLIFPPHLGAQAGTSLWPAFAGLAVSAVGLPIAGVTAVARAGGLDRLAGRVHPVFATVFTILVYLSIGPCLAIPRTASTSFQMLVPLIGGGSGLQLAYSVLFFAAAFLVALRPEKLTNWLGRILCPSLILLIVVLFAGCLAHPLAAYYGAPSAEYAALPTVQGILYGYQTMDTLAGLNFGAVIALNIRDRGVTESRAVESGTIRAGLLAGGLLLAVYAMLSHAGAQTGAVYPGLATGAEVLTALAQQLFGRAGLVLIAAIFVIACFNTCVGLIACVGQYFHQLPPRIVTVKTAFTSCYPNVPLRIFHYGRNSSQPPARQINPLKYILRFSLSEKSPVAAYPNIPVPCTKDIRRVQRFQFFTSDTLYLSGKLMQLEYSFFRSNP